MRIAQYPWYDSWWFSEHARARDTLARSSSAVLERFDQAIAPLRTRLDFQPVLLDSALDASQLAAVREVIASLERHDLGPDDLDEARRFGRFIRRNIEALSKLQRELTQMVGAAAGEEVEPTYNFLSLYGSPGVCEPHLDAPCAKWTLDICIDQSQSWPIYFSEVVPWPEDGIELGASEDWAQAIKSAHTFAPVTLQPGQAVVFSGSGQWHYRDRMPAARGRQFCDLVFFHYVPAGTRDVSRPQNWARLFGEPALEGLGGPMDDFI